MEHVAEFNLGPVSNECRVCGAISDVANGFLLQKEPDIQMKDCLVCGACYAERLPTNEYLTSLYLPEVYTPHVSGDNGLSSRAAKRLLKRIRSMLSGPISILDYGGADGNFSRVLRDQLHGMDFDFDIALTVVDIHERPMANGIRFLSVDQFESDSEQYDIVLASAVLEHLPEMSKVLKLLLEKAKKRAFFYARTPYDIPIAKLGFSNRLVWPRHLYDLGPDFWSGFFSTFNVAGSALYSGPSVIQSSLSTHPLETVFALFLKLPSYIEINLIKKIFPYKGYIWRLVGGWEVTFQLHKGEK